MVMKHAATGRTFSILCEGIENDDEEWVQDNWYLIEVFEGVESWRSPRLYDTGREHWIQQRIIPRLFSYLNTHPAATSEQIQDVLFYL